MSGPTSSLLGPRLCGRVYRIGNELRRWAWADGTGTGLRGAQPRRYTEERGRRASFAARSAGCAARCGPPARTAGATCRALAASSAGWSFALRVWAPRCDTAKLTRIELPLMETVWRLAHRRIAIQAGQRATDKSLVALQSSRPAPRGGFVTVERPVDVGADQSPALTRLRAVPDSAWRVSVLAGLAACADL